MILKVKNALHLFSQHLPNRKYVVVRNWYLQQDEDIV